MALFTFISAEGTRVPLPSLSPLSLSRSLFLLAAIQAGETEGIVPVAHAQAVRHYVHYIQFTEMAHVLHEELLLHRGGRDHNRNTNTNTNTSADLYEGDEGEEVIQGSSGYNPDRDDAFDSNHSNHYYWHLQCDGGNGPHAGQLANLGLRPSYQAGRSLQQCQARYFIERVVLRRPDVPPPPLHTSDMLSFRSVNNNNNNAAPTNNHTSGDTAAHCRPLFMSADDQQLLLELIALGDYLGDVLFLNACTAYMCAWLMNSSEEALVASYRPGSGGGGLSGEERVPVLSAMTRTRAADLDFFH